MNSVAVGSFPWQAWQMKQGIETASVLNFTCLHTSEGEGRTIGGQIHLYPSSETLAPPTCWQMVLGVRPLSLANG